MSPAQAVQNYLSRHQARERHQLDGFIGRDLKETLEKAALSTLQGKRYSHQRRIPGRLLRKVAAALLREGKKWAPPRFRTFEELHQHVKEAITRKGVGPLTIYDISHRIGHFLGIYPRLVYLHCGTARGARLFGIRGAAAPITDFPPHFRKLAPEEIEDCLCIYEDNLAAWQKARRSSRSFFLNQEYSFASSMPK